MGDLNMGRETAERVTRMRSAVVAPTYPADMPVRQLDHVLVDGLAGPFTGRAEQMELSDHCALVVDV
jgi:endonuclease/exonuclease/phosphatase family metal-dependent hydrolase